jgi:cytochrome c oxidase assembly protein Cox11
MDFMTREVFDTLIIVVIVIGMALAAVRLYRDFTRPLPPDGDWDDDDTRPNQSHK